MDCHSLSVSEIQESDIDALISYWKNADSNYLNAMGADINLLPNENEWRAMLEDQIKSPFNEKKSYCIIWRLDGKPIGHSNVNKIVFGEEAFMHLHIWNEEIRKKGLGSSFIKLTLPFYFESLKLKNLFCEPYALNPAPNKTLEKAGFKFIKEYETIPGSINFYQKVNLWQMSLAQFNSLK